MATPVLLVGNGPNQIGGGYSWAALLNELREFVGIGPAGRADDHKPFPLLFEELFLHGHAVMNRSEMDLKWFIAEHTAGIWPNLLHQALMALGCDDVLTTNYDHALELAVAEPADTRPNLGFVHERRYNLFRHYRVGGTNLWPIHGDQRLPETITLGYEHYSGYLQQMRLYTALGLTYRKGTLEPLIRRLREGDVANHSWVDFFFTRNVFIVGLGLDFVEFHLWWLLTFRARAAPQSKLPIANRIVYLCRGEKGTAAGKFEAKLSLLRASLVEVVLLGDADMPWPDFYDRAVDWLRLHC